MCEPEDRALPGRGSGQGQGLEVGTSCVSESTRKPVWLEGSGASRGGAGLVEGAGAATGHVMLGPPTLPLLPYLLAR